ncbi:RICIN domain-containing protein [Streptomyces sp. NPDC057239]|uniref:RICIN domain-containing protein n=1 Tax=Streptomyces sp. NPDC057239 TaxID=3346061 RepID=UPI00362AE77C
MPRQHEPPAGEATPAVAVRRAVSVPAPGNDPGADLRPRSPEPVPASGSAAEPAAAAAEEGRQQEQKQEQEQEQEQQQRQAAEPDGAEAEAAAGVVAAGNGDSAKADGNADADADATVPGRLRGPMVAAAAIVGAVLICVPLLVLGLTREEDRTVETAPVGGTTLDPGTSDDIPAADYQAAPPSPSVSPSGAKSASGSPAESEPKSKSESEPSPSRAAEVKAAPSSGTEKKADGEAGKPKAEKSPAITARQLANALSTRVNAQLKNVATGKCADLPYFEKGSVDGPVSQYNCRPTTKDNQLWDLEVADADGGPGGASLFVIRNRKDGMCMDLPDYGSVAAGTKVTEYHCRPAADNQLWWLDPRSGGYWIRNAASDLCMSVAGGGSAGNDARLQVVRCGSGSSALRWSVVSVVKPS